jgi:hypothetical protein
VDTLVVDKTGTLTEGKPTLMSVSSVDGVEGQTLLRLAASLEKGSEHPLAAAIVRGAQEREIKLWDAKDFEYFTGKGVTGKVEGHQVALGNVRGSRLMFAFKTLERRLIVLLVVPVTLFLLIIGIFGYRFIQGLLFKDWQEIAILRLERAAHQMDMRLHGQMQWMETFARAGQDPQGKEIQRWLMQQMKAQPGVSQVFLTWRKGLQTKGRMAIPERSAEMSPVGYFYPLDEKTVGLRGELLDQAGKPLGRLEVILSYDYLMQDVLTEGWLVAQMACLVSREGTLSGP